MQWFPGSGSPGAAVKAWWPRLWGQAAGQGQHPNGAGLGSPGQPINTSTNAVSIQSCLALTVTLGLPTGMQKDTQIQRWKRDEQTAWTEVYLKTLVTSAPTGGHAAEVGLPAGGTDQWEGCWEGGRVILVFVSNLFKLQHTFVQILKSYCLYWKIYLSELQNVFSQFKNGFVKITARRERLNSWWLNYMPWGPILTVKNWFSQIFPSQGTHRISPFSWGTK